MLEISGIGLPDKFYISIDNPMTKKELSKVLKTWNEAMQVYHTKDGYRCIGKSCGKFMFVKVVDTRGGGKWIV